MKSRHKHVCTVRNEGEIPLTHGVFASGVTSKDAAEKFAQSRRLRRVYWMRSTGRVYYNALEYAAAAAANTSAADATRVVEAQSVLARVRTQGEGSQ